MTEVIAAERIEGELLRSAALPEEVDVDVCRKPVRAVHETVHAGLAEAEQHVRCLDLRALAVSGLDLQRGVVVGEYRADAEAAFFLVENVHGGVARRCARHLA